MSKVRYILDRAISALFPIVSVAVAVIDFMAFNQILRTIIVATVRVDPLSKVASKYRAVSIERWGMILFGMVWLAGVVGLLYYYGRSETKRVLLVRFLKVIAIELALIAIAYLLPQILFAW